MSVVHCPSTDIDIPDEWRENVIITSEMHFDDKIDKATEILMKIAEKLNIDTRTKHLEQSPGGEVGGFSRANQIQPYKRDVAKRRNKLEIHDSIRVDIKGTFLSKY